MSEQRLPLQTIIETFVAMEGGLLPCLHEIQKVYGYIDPEYIADIATAFNLSRAEVHGTISFYHFFKTSAPKPVTIQICRAESCQAMGSRQLESAVQAQLANQPELAANVEVEAVYCLGNCACSPCARIGDDVMGDVKAEGLVSDAAQRIGGRHA